MSINACKKEDRWILFQINFDSDEQCIMYNNGFVFGRPSSYKLESNHPQIYSRPDTALPSLLRWGPILSLWILRFVSIWFKQLIALQKTLILKKLWYMQDIPFHVSNMTYSLQSFQPSCWYSTFILEQSRSKATLASIYPNLSASTIILLV